MSDTTHRDPYEREGSEPQEMPRGMPVLVAVLLGAIGAWGATYFWYEAGDLDDLVLGDGRTVFERQADGPGGTAAAAAEDVDGARVFAAICAACHQSTGLGLAGAFPPLDGSSWVTGDGFRPAAIVLQGLQGEIEVLGETYNGVMPGYRDQLSDPEIAAVVSYLRSSWSNDAPAIDAATVAAMREKLAGTGALKGGEGVAALTHDD